MNRDIIPSINDMGPLTQTVESMNDDRVPTRAGLTSIVVCLAAIAAPAGAAEVIPHHAVYELSLKSGGHSEVSDVTGTIEYDWEDACDGWAVSYRMDMNFLYQTGNEMQCGMKVASRGSKDGLHYRYFYTRTERGR